ncbi:MAG TPA: tetratricopeptide repeat protein [Thermoanaerobaculia bacterium]|nr:tetratricopeptide repeat protein [Thermoanaerobaculia bacterium]
MRVTASLLLLSLCLAAPLFAATAAEHAAAGNTALDRRDADKAAELFEKAVQLEPKNAKYHFLLGSAYGEMARKANVFSQASLARKTRAEFEKAVELDPNYIDARFALIQYYLIAPGFMGGGDDKAILQAAEIRKRDALDGHRAYTRIYSHQKKHDLARKEMVEAVREQPNSAKAHFYLGNVYMLEENWAAALHEYEFAQKLDPNFMPVHFRIGQWTAKSGKELARGEASLRKYLGHKPADNDPPHAATWYWLGQVQEKQGRKADAKTSYDNALKLAPGDKDVIAAKKRVSY